MTLISNPMSSLNNYVPKIPSMLMVSSRSSYEGRKSTRDCVVAVAALSGDMVKPHAGKMSLCRLPSPHSNVIPSVPLPTIASIHAGQVSASNIHTLACRAGFLVPKVKPCHLQIVPRTILPAPLKVALEASRQSYPAEYQLSRCLHKHVAQRLSKKRL